ncbi:hypothetical protein CEUSTIGMA_g8737.t1 [Chlamydomonas eustigma]|uniref:EF-hand domain-containing protein n=1 Tax=Chlamydomonas eustigma TaxID=1157962 RepID=A0A250XE26_9CHLO|nr:hypothetical protein CEUSTIGMA_g8737.t1 [Chlamydomonas eustigma]|eukprot:GAX81306.1 hypothetical protein CEUSTIGMA_g8737.t1 [Chlamydomonas eustigma]
MSSISEMSSNQVHPESEKVQALNVASEVKNNKISFDILNSGVQGVGNVFTLAGKGVMFAAKNVETGAMLVAKTAGDGAMMAAKTAGDGAKLATKTAKEIHDLKKKGALLAKLAQRESLAKLSLLTKIVVFLSLNASMLVYLFVLSLFNMQYLSVSQVSTTTGTTYSTSYSLKQSTGGFPLQVDDYYLPVSSQATPTEIAATTYKVHLLLDSVGDPGWNLQDILNVTRTYDTSLSYSKGYTKMIQNYKICASACVSSGGVPVDLEEVARNYSDIPYGFSFDDYYLDRNFLFPLIDPDFYAVSTSKYHDLGSFYGNWGQEPNATTIAYTAPTNQKYICNLGAPRKRLTGIVLKTSSCHVQVTSHAGSGYTLYSQSLMGSTAPTVAEVAVTNSTTGCQQFQLTVTVQGQSCPASFVPGVYQSCESSCALVVMKGVSARRVPIQVAADTSTSVNPSVLRIDDQFLVLDARYPWQSVSTKYIPDLLITGGAIAVDLYYARIGYISYTAGAGRFQASFVRLDFLNFNTTGTNFNNDVIIEDNRNTVLLYRNPSNFICAASPLVEQIPLDFLECDAADPNSVQQQAYMFYDTVVDGVITQTEFLDGLSRLGLSLGEGSLSLTANQAKQVLDTVFSSPDTTQATQAITMVDLSQRLQMVFPPFTTLYNTNSGIQDCFDNCTALGNTTPVCNNACMWRCQGTSINITEPTFGLCDPASGCQRTCGSPEWPMDRYSTANNNMDALALVISAFDVNYDGLISANELRGLLLQLYSNCTYLQLQSNLAVTSTTKYCAVAGAGQYVASSFSASSLYLNCNYTSGNPSTWRIKNMPANVSSLPRVDYGGYIPRECRPFPDYDPRLSGKAYDSTATSSSCPECFFMDGTRVPPQYYNRSTWDDTLYEDVMIYLRQVFTTADIGSYAIPYFNISDDTQYNIFAAKLLSPTVTSDRVSYQVFNLNIQSLSTLSFLGKKGMLFNPWCYAGTFLKIGASYSSGNSTGNLLAITDNSILYNTNGDGIIQNSHMPGFQKSTDPNTLGLLPCPPEWGNGIQGSTNFSYFEFANASIGLKWGQALPAFCMDERWPNGGQSGFYPNDFRVYGSLAGKPILPGCEPVTCLPRYNVSNGEGTIHAQVLPFEMDWKNATGAYQTMVQNCQGSDGTLKCFYKGYADNYDMSFAPQDLVTYQNIMLPCTSGQSSCSDTLMVYHMTGEGIPTHQLWFWVSRKVYMDVEPAYFYLMSGGTLVPEINHLYLRMSPAVCSSATGAVEYIDWRDSETTEVSNNELSMRLIRNSDLFYSFNSNLPGSSAANLSSNTGWYLKSVLREPFQNETLYYDSITADGITDTDPGYEDTSTGTVIGAGPSWRHKRVCNSSAHCYSSYYVYRDNCLVNRTVVTNVTGTPLSPCAFPNGTSAYANPALGENGPTFNETAYFGQFPTNLTSYQWYGSVDSLTPAGFLTRNQYVHMTGYAADNVTSYFYTKNRVALNNQQEATFADVTLGAASYNSTLLLLIILSLIIAVTCGLGAMVAIIFFGLKYLANVNIQLETVKKVQQQRITERTNDLFDMILKTKNDKILEYIDDQKTKGGLRHDDASAPLKMNNWMEKGADNSFYAYIADDAGSEDDDSEEDTFVCSELSTEEKNEILYVMEEQDYTSENVHRWNLNDMVKVWQKELKNRKSLLRKEEATPLEIFTILASNRPGLEILASGVQKNAFWKLPWRRTGNSTGSNEAALASQATITKQGSLVKQGSLIPLMANNTVDSTDQPTATTLTAAANSTSIAVAVALASKKSSSAQKMLDKEKEEAAKKEAQRKEERRIMMTGSFIERMAYANWKRVLRSLEFVRKAFMQNFPSPFKVLDTVIVHEVLIRLVNSLVTFMKVKGVFNHQLVPGEEIMLGLMSFQEEKKTRGEEQKVVACLKGLYVKDIQPNVAHSFLHRVSTITKTGSTYENGSKSRGKPLGEGMEQDEIVTQEASSSQLPAEDLGIFEDLAEEVPPRLEIDGSAATGVVAMTDDLRKELYAVKNVRVTVHKIPLQKKSAGNDVLEVFEDVGKGFQKLYKKLSQFVGGGNPQLTAHTSKLSGVKSSKLFSLEDDEDNENAYVVVVQEGMGAVIDSEAYNRADDENNRAGFSRSDTHQESSIWATRTIIMPCPALPSRQDPRKMQVGMVRTYMVVDENGPSYISIDTRGSEDGRDCMPVVEFRTTRRGFNSIYERWCNHNSLAMKEVLDEQGYLSDLNIEIIKRVVPRVKGMKLRRSAFMAALDQTIQEEEAELEGDVDHTTGSIQLDRPPSMTAKKMRKMTVDLERNIRSHTAAGNVNQPLIGASRPTTSTGAARPTTSYTGVKGPVNSSLSRQSLAPEISMHSTLPESGSVEHSVASVHKTSIRGGVSRVGSLDPTEVDSKEEPLRSVASLRKARTSPTGHDSADRDWSAEEVKGQGLSAGDPDGINGMPVIRCPQEDMETLLCRHNPMFEAVLRSDTPLARFFREECELTANFSSEYVDLETLISSFRGWMKFQQHLDTLTLRRQNTSKSPMSDCTDDVEVLETSHLQLPLNPNLEHLDLGQHLNVQTELKGALTAPSPASPQLDIGSCISPHGLNGALLVSLTLPNNGVDVSAGAAMEEDYKIYPEDVEAFGLKYAEEENYILLGVMIDLKDLDDDPEDANRLLWLALDAINVAVHTIFIWALAVPLAAACIAFLGVYGESTGIEHLLTFTLFREDPATFSKLYVQSFIKAIFIVALVWIAFCYIQLSVYYTLGDKYIKKAWFIAVQSLFWFYLLAMLAVLVAYLFEIITWLILGCVVDPSKYLPYSVATITLLIHTQTTFNRLKLEIKNFKAKVLEVVLGVFANKLRNAMEFAKKAAGSAKEFLDQAVEKAEGVKDLAMEQVEGVKDKVMGSMEKVQGQVMGEVSTIKGQVMKDISHVQGNVGSTLSSFPGATGSRPTSATRPASRNSRPDSASGNTMTVAPLNPALTKAMELFAMDPSQYATMHSQVSSAARPSSASRQQPTSAGSSSPPPSSSAAGAMSELLNFGRPAGYHRLATVDESYPQGGQPLGEATDPLSPAPVTTAAATNANSGGGGGGGNVPLLGINSVTGEPQALKPYQIYNLYSDDNDGLKYAGFVRLLDHLEIKINYDKRRELFARFCGKDDTLGYKEFEMVYATIQAQIIMNTLKEYGFTTGRLIILLCYAVTVLILIFVFIFVGVAAFTGAGTLGAVVNSLLAAGAGIGMNLKETNKTEDTSQVTVKIGDEEHTGGGTADPLSAAG